MPSRTKLSALKDDNKYNQECSIYNAIKNYLGEVVGKYEPKLEKKILSVKNRRTKDSL